MTKFLKNLGLSLLVFFLLDKAFIPYLNFLPKTEQDQRLGMVLSGQMNMDIIITGSSRGARDILAEELAATLKKKCYNLSYRGSDTEFHLFLLKTLLQFNKAPKVLILALDDPEGFTSPKFGYPFEKLLPYSGYDVINNELIKRDKKSFVSKILVLARINGNQIVWKKKPLKRVDSLRECGSMPLSFQRTDRKFNIITDNNSYQVKNEIPERVNCFLEIQQTCEKAGIQLVTVIPPNFYPSNPAFEARIRSLCKPGTLLFMDDREKIYRNKALFYDEGHMQLNGARIYTSELCKYLKNIPALSQ